MRNLIGRLCNFLYAWETIVIYHGLAPRKYPMIRRCSRVRYIFGIRKD